LEGRICLRRQEARHLQGGTMIDIGLALTWAAISAASAKGLSALARTAAGGQDEPEPAMPNEANALLSGLRSIGAAPGAASEPR
jgi:hypothetical protein